MDLFEIDFQYAESLVKYTQSGMPDIKHAVDRLWKLHDRYCSYFHDGDNLWFDEAYEGADVIAWKYTQGLVNLLDSKDFKDREKYISQLDILNEIYERDNILTKLTDRERTIFKNYEKCGG